VKRLGFQGVGVLKLSKVSDTKRNCNEPFTSIQPRMRLTRSLDEASHTYLGYAIKIAGAIDGEDKDFSFIV